MEPRHQRECGRMEHVVDPFHRLIYAVVISDITDMELEPRIVQGDAHFFLFLLVSAEAAERLFGPLSDASKLAERAGGSRAPFGGLELVSRQPRNLLTRRIEKLIQPGEKHDRRTNRRLPAILSSWFLHIDLGD